MSSHFPFHSHKASRHSFTAAHLRSFTCRQKMCQVPSCATKSQSDKTTERRKSIVRAHHRLRSVLRRILSAIPSPYTTLLRNHNSQPHQASLTTRPDQTRPDSTMSRQFAMKWNEGDDRQSLESFSIISRNGLFSLLNCCPPNLYPPITR